MKRVALVVGVNHYEDREIVPLRGAQKDAIDLHAMLRRIGFDEVRPLVETAAEADKVIEAACELADGLGPGDLFLFFFAGHGVEHQRRHLLLCPRVKYRRIQDTDRDTVPVDLLLKETAKAGVSRVLILDACRSEPVRTRGGGGEGFRGGVLRDLVGGGTGSVGPLTLLCSCGEGEVAQELPEEDHGLFTRALLDELEASARAGREVRLGTDFKDALRSRMQEVGRRHGLSVNQEPLFQQRGEVTILIPGQSRGHGSRREDAEGEEPEGGVAGLLRQARERLAANDLGRAEELVQKALDQEPGQPEGVALQEGIRQMRAQVDELVEESRKAIPRAEFGEAEEKLREAAQIWESCQELSRTRDMVATARGEYERLLALAAQASEDRALGRAQALLKKALEICPKSDEARQELEKTEESQDEAFALVEKASTAISRGCFREAQDKLRQAKAIWRTFHELAQVTELLGQAWNEDREVARRSKLLARLREYTASEGCRLNEQEIRFLHGFTRCEPVTEDECALSDLLERTLLRDPLEPPPMRTLRALIRGVIDQEREPRHIEWPEFCNYLYVAESVHPVLGVPITSFRVGSCLVSVKEFLAFVEDKVYDQPSDLSDMRQKRMIWTRAGFAWVERERDQLLGQIEELRAQPDVEAPVNGISWYESAAYCNWLTLRTSGHQRFPGAAAARLPYRLEGDVDLAAGFRLPTEAEMETLVRQHGLRAGGLGSHWEWLSEGWVSHHRHRAAVVRRQERDPFVLPTGAHGRTIVRWSAGGARRECLDPCTRQSDVSFRVCCRG